MPPVPPADRTSEIRALFPYLAQRIYLDTAAAGICWQGHGAAVARFYEEVKNRGYDARPEWWAMIDKVRTRLAQWLGAAPEDITFVSNTTEGLNLAAHSLQFRAGDRIVCAEDEFPSVARIWRNAEQAGAQVVRVRIPREEDRQACLMAAAVHGTRVLAVSHTHSGTGTTLDLATLGRHCRRRGTLFMVDGIQALGAVPVDLGLVDIYASSFFKWMLSGFGFGVLVTSARAREALVPAWQGYANMDDAGQLQYAHVNTPALYGLDATLDVLESIGWDTIHARVRALGERLIAEADRNGLDLVTPRDQHAGIIVFRAPDGEAVRQRLSERDISVAARGAGVRVSPHFYNTPEEVEQCAAALAQVLATS